jgi:CheY-like chemotaxis protein
MTPATPSTVTAFPFTGRLRQLPKIAQQILIIDDDPRYPLLLRANLNILHNYAAEITIAKSLGRALDTLRESPPDLVFVSDVLRPQSSFAYVRRCIGQTGYIGPIIVCADLTRLEKKRDLILAGATLALDRENTQTATIVEVIVRCLGGNRMPEYQSL